MGKIKFLPPIIFAFITGIFLIGMYTKDDALPSTMIGNAPRNITEATISGFDGFDSSIFHKDVVIVNFWASWCPPCREEHEDLMALKELGLPIVGVNLKDRTEQATQFLNKYGNPFAQVAFDNNAHTSIDWGVTAPPETFIVENGIVTFRHAGPVTDNQIKEIIYKK